MFLILTETTTADEGAKPDTPKTAKPDSPKTPSSSDSDKSDGEGTKAHKCGKKPARRQIIESLSSSESEDTSTSPTSFIAGKNRKPPSVKLSTENRLHANKYLQQRPFMWNTLTDEYTKKKKDAS